MKGNQSSLLLANSSLLLIYSIPPSVCLFLSLERNWLSPCLAFFSSICLFTSLPVLVLLRLSLCLLLLFLHKLHVCSLPFHTVFCPSFPLYGPRVSKPVTTHRQQLLKPSELRTVLSLFQKQLDVIWIKNGLPVDNQNQILAMMPDRLHGRLQWNIIYSAFTYNMLCKLGYKTVVDWLELISLMIERS